MGCSSSKEIQSEPGPRVRRVGMDEREGICGPFRSIVVHMFDLIVAMKHAYITLNNTEDRRKELDMERRIARAGRSFGTGPGGAWKAESTARY